MATATEKKAAYREAQRVREAVRRERLGLMPYELPRSAKRVRKAPQPRPAYGSQEWAETRADDLGESRDF